MVAMESTSVPSVETAKILITPLLGAGSTVSKLSRRSLSAPRNHTLSNIEDRLTMSESDWSAGLIRSCFLSKFYDGEA